MHQKFVLQVQSFDYKNLNQKNYFLKQLKTTIKIFLDYFYNQINKSFNYL